MKDTTEAQFEEWITKPFRCSHEGCLSDDVCERQSFGCYAGRYCDPHWKTSGYRDATDPDAEFDPTYAGERIENDY
jgi:hypothetical protein